MSDANTFNDEAVTDDDYFAGRAGKSERLAEQNRVNVFTGGTPIPRSDAFDALSSLGEVLYAVRTPDGLVKIGHTRNMRNRMHTVVLGETEVLAFKFGTRADELAIHRQLAPHVARGREWYHPTPEVMALVNSWREALGRESLAA